MIVRQFRDNDANQISTLIIQCLRDVNSKYYPATVIDRMITLYTPEKIIERSKTQLILVAEEMDEVCGTATVSENYFGSVFVRPKLHRSGIGNKLMDSLERLIKSNGMTQVILHASINAVAFYEQRGYKKIKQVEDEIFGKSFEMVKQLN